LKRITAIILSACLLIGLAVPPMIFAYDGDSENDNPVIVEYTAEEVVNAEYIEEVETSEIAEPDNDNLAVAEDISDETEAMYEVEDASYEPEIVDETEDTPYEPEAEKETEDTNEGLYTSDEDEYNIDDTDMAKEESENINDKSEALEEEEAEENEEDEEEGEEDEEDEEKDAKKGGAAEAIAEAIKIHIELDDERNVTVTATEEIVYEVVDEGGNSDILVVLKSDGETDVFEEDISVSLPDSWAWMYRDDTDDDDDICKDITIILYKISTNKKARSETPYFSQDEINNQDMWYTEADVVIDLAETPTTDVYTRLRNLIQGAQTGVTHIIIPFHINTGRITGDNSVVRVPDGATVVLIGAHPTEGNGQIVISNTNSAISQTFRVRGNGTEQCALVLRNVALQNSAASTAQAIPVSPPAPLPIASQTGTSRGGGVAVESSGGGGHFVLCRGGELRYTSTNTNGVVNVQSNSRFTMMQGSLIHNNVAGNSGGGVNVGGSNAVFNMHGGEIRDNHARGEETTSAQMRAVGGGVLVQDGGTFNMYDGEISKNSARLEGVVTASNAIVTSSGGGVFVTGFRSSFNMHEGRIEGNSATRTGSSNLAATSRDPLRAGSGGGVFLNGGSSFIMYGGHIKDNEATATNRPITTDGEAVNLSNGGGVCVTGTGTIFHMKNGTISNNRAERVVNSVSSSALYQTITFAGNGGGVHVYNNAQFIMDDGKIHGNIATATGSVTVQNSVNGVILSSGGGVFVGGTGDSGAVENGKFTMNGGEIRNNEAVGTMANSATVSGNGGGVCVMTEASFVMTGGLISENSATDSNPTTAAQDYFRRGNGANVYLRNPGGKLIFSMSGGEIRDNRAISNNGAGIFQSNGRVEISGTALIENNNSPKHGGGIYVDGEGTLNISSGTINGNTARENGGGIYLSSTSATLNIKSGFITNNTANDGGGLFVPHLNLSSNLRRVTIDPPTEFSGNVARNGVRIDSDLAAATRQWIRPGTVSVAWVETNPGGSGNFADGSPHPFTNYDINAAGPRFWRVTYAVGEGEGAVAAQIGSNGHNITDGYFAPEGATVAFVAKEANMFDRWELGSRPREKNDDGSEVDFSFETLTGTPLSHVIAAHTHAIGNFKGAQPITLTVSKKVEGALGNLYEQFEFNVVFKDVDGNPLAQGLGFKYTGDVIENSGASPLESGELILDDSGSAIFKLGHGQVINIDDIPVGTHVQIIERTGHVYTVSFIDSENPDVVVNGNDTTSLLMTVDRTFEFTNRRSDVPMTGINTGDITAALLLPALLTLSALMAFTVRSIIRKRKMFKICGAKTPFRV